MLFLPLKHPLCARDCSKHGDVAGNQVRVFSCRADILLEREQDRLKTEQPRDLTGIGGRGLMRSGEKNPIGRRAGKASRRSWYFVGSKGLIQAEETANAKAL